MSISIKLYLKTNKVFHESELKKLKKEVDSKLSEKYSFDIVLGRELSNTIDWRRYRDDPPHASEARFLTKEISGIEVWAGGNTGPGSNDKLITSKTVLNWISHMDEKLPPIIPKKQRCEEHMFDSNHDSWKHGEDQYVYKYCSWADVRDYVLSDKKTLRLSDVRSMNDPLEFSRFNIPLYGIPDTVESPLLIWDSIERATKRGVRYFCCSQDVPSDYNLRTRFMRQPAVRGFDHPAMWNHYGDQHEGVCLILKKNKLNQAINEGMPSDGKILCDSVRYIPNKFSWKFHENLFPFVEGMQNFSQEQLDAHFRNRAIEIAPHLFFSKSGEWANETEYRWVFLGTGEGPINFPLSGSLAGIILGSDFDNAHHAEAQTLADQNGVPIRRIWWKNGFANTPWGLEAFDAPDTLATWSEEAALRRKNRSKS